MSGPGTGPGGVPGLVLRLSGPEVELLTRLAGQVEALLDGGVPERGGDRVRDRLFPRAYLDPTEEEAESEWQAAVHPDLVGAKRDALGVLASTLAAGRPRRRGGRWEVRLDAGEVERWVTALNDARLVLGTLLDVRDDEPTPEPGDGPDAPMRAAYAFLTALQAELVDWLAGSVDGPDDGPDDDRETG